MIVGKLSEEIAMQRIIDKALIAKNILATGAQVPVISANNPAQKVIHQAINNLENDIRSLVFESQIRKQMMSDTLSQVFNYSNQAQNRALETHVTSNAPLMENGAKKDRP